MSPDDPRVLRVRDQLVMAGIEVDQPTSSHFVFEQDGVGFTFDPSQTSIAEVEQSLFRSIRSNDFHVVVPGYMNDDLYVGRSTVTEFAWAVRHRRPVIATNQFLLSPALPSVCREVIEFSRDSITYVDIMKSDRDGLATAAHRASCRRSRALPVQLISELDAFVATYLEGFNR